MPLYFPVKMKKPRRFKIFAVAIMEISTFVKKYGMQKISGIANSNKYQSRLQFRSSVVKPKCRFILHLF